MGSETTLWEVLGSLKDDDIKSSIIPLFGKRGDHFLKNMKLAHAFQNGKARIRKPDTAGIDYAEGAYLDVFWSTCEDWTKPSFKKPRLISRAEEFQDIGAPSSFGKPSGWPTWQKQNRDHEIFCLRPAGKRHSWINICIMHPVFGEIIETLESGVPETVDYQFAAELCAVMPDAFQVENARRDSVNSIFNKYLSSGNSYVAVQCIADKFDTDGTCKEAGINIEYKDEKGKGDSDPYMQNIGYFIQYWGENKDGPKRHCCPWLLVEILGQEIGISGAVWACGYPCAQPLSCNVPFLQVPADNRATKIQARLCKAIRHGFNSLRRFYAEVPTTESLEAGLPYMKEIVLVDGSKRTLKYLAPFHKNSGKMLFIAQMEEKQVLVKFTNQYNKRAHEITAEANLAPGLLCAQQVSGLIMVVMELIEDGET